MRHTHSQRIFSISMLILTLISHAYTFSTPITMNTTASATLNTYQTDLASCSCNLHSTICDNFCCCDSSCSSSQITTWSSSGLCRAVSSSLQSFCDQLSSGDRYSFQDLACVYYSNRGNIGYFYSYPQSGSVTYPASTKFASKAQADESIDLTSSSASTNIYSSSELLLKMEKDSTKKYFQLWTPIANGNCGIGFLNISQSTSYTCQYPLSAQTCAASTTHLEATTGINICKNGNCTTPQSFTPLSAATDGGTACSNMITGQTIVITLSSSTGGEYLIDSITPTISTGTVTYSGNQRYSITTTITINKPAASTEVSGNPGYQSGKVTSFQSPAGTAFDLFEIADASGNCLTAGTTLVSVLFGQDMVLSCISATPCGSTLYVDTIPQQSTLTIQQWASDTSATIKVSGTNSTINTCNFETITLNILYSDAGWLLDQQSYVIGSSIEILSSAQTTWDTKYFRVKWIYVDSGDITAPPSNQFYTYFENLWKPLREAFGAYK